MNNIWKHSQATRVIIELEFNPEKVKFMISDNGCGFELPEGVGQITQSDRLGLIRMQERARLMGGDLMIKSALGEGTMVTVEVQA